MREIEIIDKEMLQINNETLVGWIVWFCDGGDIQIFNSKHHDWVNIPKIGVQYFYRIYEANYMEQVSGSDYYCPYQLMNVEDIRPWIKFGLMINHDKLNIIFEQVKLFTLEDFNDL